MTNIYIRLYCLPWMTQSNYRNKMFIFVLFSKHNHNCKYSTNLKYFGKDFFCSEVKFYYRYTIKSQIVVVRKVVDLVRPSLIFRLFKFMTFYQFRRSVHEKSFGSLFLIYFSPHSSRKGLFLFSFDVKFFDVVIVYLFYV